METKLHGTWRNNMSNNALQKIRERLAAAEQQTNRQFDNAVFPFWNMKTGGTSLVRFLPDANSTNTFYWVEKSQIKLPFAGIKGGDQKTVFVNVPCVEMWGREAFPQGCPILAEVRAWYKDPALVEQANKYWKKPSYIMQGFVRENGVSDDKVPENPIRRFSLNKQLFNLVKAGLMDKDMENIPCDFEKGTDFKIIKTQNGSYADYGTSSYSRRESSLTADELAAIEKYGLSDLSEFLGKKPTAVELQIISDMFAASLDGEQYDNEKWGTYYRPAGIKPLSDEAAKPESGDAGSKTSNIADTASEKTKSNAESAPATTSTKANAADILAMLKNRGPKTS